MKVRHIGGTYLAEGNDLDLTVGKVYDVLSIERSWYRIVGDEPFDDDYLYPPELFEIVEE